MQFARGGKLFGWTKDVNHAADSQTRRIAAFAVTLLKKPIARQVSWKGCLDRQLSQAET
jgi:hypothetical protein